MARDIGVSNYSIERIEELRDNLHVFDFEVSQTDMNKLRTLNEQWSPLGRLQYV